MPAYTLRGCTVADGPAVARNNMTAFWEDPTWVLLWGDRTRDHVVAQCARRAPWNLVVDRRCKRHEVAVDAATGAVVGYARWRLPERLAAATTTTAWPEAQTPAVPADDEEALAAEFAAADWNFRDLEGIDDHCHAVRAKYFAQREYMELEYLAVHPDNKGRGIGSMLVASGIAQAEKLGVDIYLMAYKAGLHMYQRLGFNMLQYKIQDDSKWGGKGEYGTYFLEKVIVPRVPRAPRDG